LVPASDRGDDLVRIGGPFEGFGLDVVLFEKPVDGGPEIDGGSEDAVFKRRLVRMAKKPSIALSHEHEVGVKWNVQRGCAASHLRSCRFRRR
jgi:hypothetical protein